MRPGTLIGACCVVFAALAGGCTSAHSRDVAVSPRSSASSRRTAYGKEWTTTNLTITIDTSYCYADAEANCRRYGRLYQWDAAVRACQSLGAAWRLPTDDEWHQLAARYGGASDHSADSGRSAYTALIQGGRSGFDAVLGGGRVDGQYSRLDAHGFYWTASGADSAHAVFYNFGRGGLALHRQDGGDKRSAFSVRCVRD